MSHTYYAPAWPVKTFDPGLGQTISNFTPIPPPLPPAPTLAMTMDMGASFIQTSNGSNVSGGLVRLYLWDRFGGFWTLFAEQPFAPRFDWTAFVGNSWQGAATEIGNDAVYSGESPKSPMAIWSAP
jgi:hypothetical protein